MHGDEEPFRDRIDDLGYKLENVRASVDEIKTALNGGDGGVIRAVAPFAWTYLLLGVGYGVALGLQHDWISGLLGGLFWPFAVGWSIASGTICRP